MGPHPDPLLRKRKARNLNRNEMYKPKGDETSGIIVYRLNNEKATDSVKAFENIKLFIESDIKLLLPGEKVRIPV